MVLVEVRYELKEGCRKAFYDRLVSEGIGDASRNDEGNEKYDYYFDPENENEMILLEHWADAESLRKHSQAEHMKKMAAFRSDYVIRSTIHRFESKEF